MMFCHSMDRALLLCYCVDQVKRVLQLLIYPHLHSRSSSQTILLA
nr:unnamed protein product [Callosobruchus chinensis]